MHMSDALLSPIVGGGFWVVSASILAYSAKKIKDDPEESQIPMMGVMSAFVFAAQMINIAIPGTGSSGHLGGGVLLAIFLGPYRAFLAIASILLVQCLMFADGGLMALGANIFNMGFIGALLAYPFIWKPLAGDCSSKSKIITATMLASIATLVLGAFGVVFQTVISGASDLSLTTFTLFMVPIHVAIGVVEGLVTTGIVLFVIKLRPDLLQSVSNNKTGFSWKAPVVIFSCAVLIAGLFSWYASNNPDGLEWSIQKASGQEELESPEDGVHSFFGNIIENISIFPDYEFKKSEDQTNAAAKAGTSVSGLIGIVLTMMVAVILGLVFRKRKKKSLPDVNH
ncbi:MAG: energy-coupling factor ABC transporter permease [Fibrobacteria bacterium]|nr:energy-coupling factor ABC transporter permease [Fibrobacteria bacterium]